MFHIKVAGTLETHILCSVIFFFLENPCVYELMWKNTVERCRLQLTTRRMRIPNWMPKATNTLTSCVIRIAFPLQQWLHERASILHYAYIASLCFQMENYTSYLVIYVICLLLQTKVYSYKTKDSLVR